MSIDALQEKIRTFKNPSMVGLDPSPEVIPAGVLKKYFFPARGDAPGAFQGLFSFLPQYPGSSPGDGARRKIQTACFEILGSYGVAVMQELCAAANEMGYYVLLDAMRGDAPHIAELYAGAVFGDISTAGKSIIPMSATA